MKVIQTTALCKSYGRKRVVDNVYLNVGQGEVYGFIGRNGAGKSTTLKMISGLIFPTSGEIRLFGKTPQDVTSRRRTGILIEETGLYANFSARDNLMFKAGILGIVDAKKRVDELLEMFDLTNTGKKKTKQFSMGMKRRLGIAMAVLGKPDLLILDEPINGLDPEGIIQVRKILKRLNEEEHMTMIISSHILGELSKVATYYGIIKNGCLVEEISDSELKEKCQDYIHLSVNEPKKAAVILETKLGISSYQIRPDGEIRIFMPCDTGSVASSLSSEGIIIKEIFVHAVDLENYFLDLMGGEADV